MSQYIMLDEQSIITFLRNVIIPVRKVLQNEVAFFFHSFPFKKILGIAKY